MATESPMIRDGAQTIAAANYGNTQSLAGPSGSGQFLAVMISTSADRTSVLASTTGQQIYGILQNKPATGEACDVGIFGVTKAVAGGTITRGNPVMAFSDGTIHAWTAGSGYAQCGYALESAVSGQIFTMFVGATSPKVLT